MKALYFYMSTASFKDKIISDFQNTGSYQLLTFLYSACYSDISDYFKTSPSNFSPYALHMNITIEIHILKLHPSKQ